MQFIKNGPDIPNELLQAHEEGRVVFFCGAGISIPAGLPNFETFVEKIYKLNGECKTKSEKDTFDAEEYDTTLDQFERRITGGRKKLREVIPEILTPTPGKRGATKTHQALLQLGLSRDGHLRLVTTNYDRLFHLAAKKIKMPFKEHGAPSLPIPKKSRWDGLVFLHGVLPKDVTQNSDLNSLVMTSGDFGVAYLTEGWAARFVIELFRNWVVVFVGYRINDPVMRYMMDALAADRRQGERTPQAWVFADCSPGKEAEEKSKWEAKGVRPILYPWGTEGDKHVGLHKSLHAWAAAYTSGIEGKENLVLQLCLTHPQKSTPQDDFVGRMLWALSDPSGLPAKRFAESKPAPPLDWFFDVFTQNNFSSKDLPRFGVTNRNEEDSSLKFSILNRPASYEHGAWMNLTGFSVTKWDEVFEYLAIWLTFYLNDPRLILWFSAQEGCICPRLKNLFISTLKRYSAFSKKQAEDFKKEYPFSIPTPRMEKLWWALLTGRMRNRTEEFYYENRLKIKEMDSIARVDLRRRLSPIIILRKIPLIGDSSDISECLDCELALQDEEVIEQIKKALLDITKENLLSLISELELVLKDALDLILEINGHVRWPDISFLDLPSIEEHPQNQGFQNWVRLIELLRDCWLKLLDIDVLRANQRALDWFEQSQITFKRLALFAGSKNKEIPPEIWVAWLLANDAFCLWALETQRETCRLLVLQGSHLNLRTQRQLESEILQGPPRGMYSQSLKPARWKEIKEHEIWLRLIKLKLSGLTLSKKAASCFEKISKSHPEWTTYPAEREEFSRWLSTSDDPDFNDFLKTESPPTDLDELINWLEKYKEDERLFFRGKWMEVCRSFYEVCMQALISLARQNEWPEGAWQAALQTWSQKETAEKSWKVLAPLVISKEIIITDALLPSFTSWLEFNSRIPVIPEKEILDCCRIILESLQNSKVDSLSENIYESEDAVTSAITKPAGNLASSIINQINKRKFSDKECLPPEYREFLDLFCNREFPLFAPARVILASNTINLYRIDPEWIKEKLLPFFDWKNPREASFVWQGFLWSPRLYIPLLHPIKEQLFDTAKHTEELERLREQYATFLTYLALSPSEEFTREELMIAFRELKKEDLETASQALLQAFQSTEAKKEIYWRSRVWPFIQNIWPKSMNLVSPRIAEDFAQVALASGSRFPEALSVVQPWISSIEETSVVINMLRESTLCEQFPEEALTMLDTIISERPNQYRFLDIGDFTECLDQISVHLPNIREDKRFKKLEEFLRRRSV